jgi:hypothetical protein
VTIYGHCLTLGLLFKVIKQIQLNDVKQVRKRTKIAQAATLNNGLPAISTTVPVKSHERDASLPKTIIRKLTGPPEAINDDVNSVSVNLLASFIVKPLPEVGLSNI